MYQFTNTWKNSMQEHAIMRQNSLQEHARNQTRIMAGAWGEGFMSRSTTRTKNIWIESRSTTRTKNAWMGEKKEKRAALKAPEIADEEWEMVAVAVGMCRAVASLPRGRQVCVVSSCLVPPSSRNQSWGLEVGFGFRAYWTWGSPFRSYVNSWPGENE